MAELVLGVFVSLLCLIGQVVLHEGAHAFTQVIFGGRLSKFGWNRYGAYVVRQRLDRNWKNVVVVLAGPLANLIAWPVLRYYKIPFANLSLFLAVVNLIPIQNSDGYKAYQYARGIYA